ncbi:ArsR/SmtB family transcription factor [Saccharibacillus qingshengii]|uniref:ArsR/SmtB family transcription factor n=1 Tax=Saccharibacillus qingshengii TaxID=1763540 RepID=UPI001555C350|nr:metalloregulator ArsR/SmtB family transcription factor [Saccharibacillus qingshengii]
MAHTVNNEESLDTVSQTLKLLGDKTRLTIMKLLDEQECCVCELVAIFNTSQPAVSQHLRKLKDAGFLQEKRRGQWIFYSVNRENNQYELLQSLIARLPSQLYRIEELEKKGLRISCG